VPTNAVYEKLKQHFPINKIKSNGYTNFMVLYKSVWVAQFGLIKEKSSLPVKT
jgi:hypothetical protein